MLLSFFRKKTNNVKDSNKQTSNTKKIDNVKYIDKQTNNGNVKLLGIFVVLTLIFTIYYVSLSGTNTPIMANKQIIYDDANLSKENKHIEINQSGTEDKTIVHHDNQLNKSSNLPSLNLSEFNKKYSDKEKEAIIINQQFTKQQNIKKYEEIAKKIDNKIIDDIAIDIYRIHAVDDTFYSFCKRYYTTHIQSQGNKFNNILTQIIFNIFISCNMPISDSIYFLIEKQIRDLNNEIESFIILGDDINRQKIYKSLSILLNIKYNKEDNHIADIFNRFLYQYTKEEITIFFTEIIAKVYYPNDKDKKLHLYNNIFAYMERQMSSKREIISSGKNKIIYPSKKENKQPLTLLDILSQSILHKQLKIYDNKEILIPKNQQNYITHDAYKKLDNTITNINSAQANLNKLSNIDIWKFKEVYSIYTNNDIQDTEFTPETYYIDEKNIHTLQLPKLRLRNKAENKQQNKFVWFAGQVIGELLNPTKGEKISIQYIEKNIYGIMTHISKTYIASKINQKIYNFNQKCIKDEQAKEENINIIDNIFIDIYNNMETNFHKENYINEINELNNSYCAVSLGKPKKKVTNSIEGQKRKVTDSIGQPSRLMSHILYLLFINKDNTVLINLTVFIYQVASTIDNENIPYIKDFVSILNIIEVIIQYRNHFAICVQQEPYQIADEQKTGIVTSITNTGKKFMNSVLSIFTK